jgi:hypothetical protein
MYVAFLANYLECSQQFSDGCINLDSFQDIYEIIHLKVTNTYKITTWCRHHTAVRSDYMCQNAAYIQHYRLRWVFFKLLNYPT